MRPFIKKILSLVLSCCCILSVSACNVNDNTPSTSCTHNYIGSTTKEATCKETGIKTYTCTECGNSYTEDIAKSTNHSYTSKVTKEATSEETGIITYTCNICGNSYTETIDKIQVENIILSKTEITIGEGEEFSLVAIVTPANIKPNLTWKSSDSTIVEVDKNGKIKANKQGEALITVQSNNGKIAMCNVIVYKKVGSVKGSVLYYKNGASTADVGASVYLISTERTDFGNFPYYSFPIDYSTKVNSNGTYELNNIPVGEYFIIIVSANKRGDDSTIEDKFGGIYDRLSDERKESAIEYSNSQYSSAIRTRTIIIENNEIEEISVDFRYIKV